MEKQLDSSSGDTCASNGSSEVQHPPVFRPSILNVCPKPLATPKDSDQSDEKLTPTVNAALPSKPIQITPSVTVPVIAPLKEESAPKGYVFGSNISSRVVNAEVTQGASSNLWDVAKTDEVSSSSSVFTALAKAVTSKKVNKDGCSEQTLEDSANKVSEDQKHATVTLAQVEAFTGEEGETQVFRMHCRAYVFDTDKQNWNALGASHFHLNDIPKNEGDCSPGCRSRVVVRLMSTRRVIINTPVWDTMPVAVVDSRSLRIGAINEDGDQLRSYLFKFPPDESASKICAALNARKAKAAEANISKVPDSTTPRIAGQKRSLGASVDQPTSAISSSLSTQPDRLVDGSTEGVQSTVTQNPSSIFRPSVLCASEGSSVVHLQSTTPVKNPEVSSGILFRQSALDPVVKRLRSDQSSSEPFRNSRPEDKSNQPINIPPVPTAAVVSLPTTGGVSGNFVFGQNISDRVKNASASSSSQDLSTVESREEDSAEEHDTVEITPCPSTLTDSASAVAAELRDKPTILSDEIPKEPILTGEEGECTVLKTYCKFYDFDREKQLWVERGNAYVHLNDIPIPVTGADASRSVTVRPPTGPPTRSRMVVRVCKTLKLLANTPLWSGLNVAMADERSIRLTTICFTNAEDHAAQEKQSTETPAKSEFRAYLLVMRSPNDATRLYQALIARKNVTTRNQLNDDDSTEIDDSPPDRGTAYEANDGELRLATGTVEAAVEQNPV